MNTNYQFKLDIPGVDPEKLKITNSRDVFNDIVLEFTHAVEDGVVSTTLDRTDGFDLDRIDYKFGQLLIAVKPKAQVAANKASVPINLL